MIISRVEEFARKSGRPDLIKIAEDQKKLLTERMQEAIQVRTKYYDQKKKEYAYLKSVRDNLALKLEEIRLARDRQIRHNS